MATLYLNNENDFLYTEKTVIMQRTNLVDQLKILVPRYYGTSIDTSLDVDMLDGFEVYLHYVTPISKHHRLLRLILDNENYNEATSDVDIVMSYKLPICLDLTAESGSMEMWLAFYKVDIRIDDENKLVMTTPVRQSKAAFIPITKVSDYDDLMIDFEHSAITKKMLEIEKLLQKANGAAQDMIDFIPADVKIVEQWDKLMLMNKDELPIGTGIPMKDVAYNVGVKNTGIDGDGIQDGVTDLDAAIDRPVDDEDEDQNVIDLDKELNKLNNPSKDVIDLDNELDQYGNGISMASEDVIDLDALLSRMKE